MPSLDRRLHLLNAALLLGLWGGSLWAYPQLPETIPMHYGLTGAADRLADATLGRWLLLPVVAVLTAVSTYGGAFVIRAQPEALSVPSADARQLNEAGRRRLAAATQRLLYGMTALVTGLFGALQVGNYLVAVHELTALPPPISGAIYGAIGAILALTVGHVIYQRRLADRLVDRDTYIRSAHPSD